MKNKTFPLHIPPQQYRCRWPWIGSWGALLLLLGAALTMASMVEDEVYTTLEQTVQAGVHVQIVSDARAFLQHFPRSAKRSQVQLWLAEALYATRAYREAAVVYQELLQHMPTDRLAARVLRQLGLSYLHSQEYNAAVTTFTQWLEQYPGSQESPQIVFYLANSYFALSRFAEAFPLYQQLLQETDLPVAVTTVHLRLGDCYFFQQQFAAAQQQYQRLLQEFPQSEAALQATYQLGAVALAQKQFGTARQHFQSVVQAKAPPALLLQAQHALAWAFYHQGQVAQAVGHLRQQRLLATPPAAETVLAQAYDLLLLESYQEGLPLLRQVEQSGHDTARESWLLWLLAQAYDGSGALGQALRVLDEFVERFPRHARVAEAHRWRADLLLRQRDTSAAFLAYWTTVSVAVEDEQAERALWAMGELYQEQRALADAIAVWQHFLLTFPLSPRRVEVQLRLGAAFVQQGAIAQAVALYNDLLRLSLERHQQLQTQWQLAWAHLKGGEQQKALELLSNLIEAAPGTDVLRRARFWRGWLWQQQGRYEASSTEWQALLLLEPPGARRGEVLWRLGTALMALKQYKEAREALEQVVTEHPLEPYASLATWRLQHCLLELQQSQEALNYVPGFLAHDPLGFFSLAKRFAQGEQLFRAKHYQQARQIFRHVMEQPFGHVLADDAEFMVAESHFAEGDTRRALRHYRAVTQQYAQSNVAPLAYFRAGGILAEAEQYGAAAHALEQAVQRATDVHMRGQAAYQLGKAYMALEQRDAALTVFRGLVHGGLAPSATDPERLNLGLMLQQLGDYEQALLAFRHVLQRSPPAPELIRAEAQFWIAETHQLRGDSSAALVAYQEVAQRYAQHRMWSLTALFRAGEIYEALQQYAQAIAMFQRVATVDPHDKQGRIAAERVKYLKARILKTSAQEG
jgi:TolA-binding protein